MKIKPNTKIKIDSQEHSEYVQKLAFESGFSWFGDGTLMAKYKNKPYLFFNKSFKIKFCSTSAAFNKDDSEEVFIYIPAEKPRHRIVGNHFSTQAIEPMHVKLGMEKDEFYKTLKESLNHEPPSIEFRVLSEKMGFKELCPVCSPKDWQEREAETYDELRDAHLDLVRETMEKDKEIELLKQRIKDMHSALNYIESMADKIKVSTNV